MLLVCTGRECRLACSHELVKGTRTGSANEIVKSNRQSRDGFRYSPPEVSGLQHSHNIVSQATLSYRRPLFGPRNA